MRDGQGGTGIVKSYEANSTIAASPDAIWEILVDAPGYAEWDSGVVRIEGRIEPGNRIKVVSEANPGRSFPVKVTEFSPGRKLVWSGGMPLGLFKGVRTFTLSRGEGGPTEFRVREEYTGPLLGMIWKSMPDLGPSFQRFATGLKRKAESRQPSP
jgi:hypothetical protein